jgi:hypothetical protein
VYSVAQGSRAGESERLLTARAPALSRRGIWCMLRRRETRGGQPATIAQQMRSLAVATPAARTGMTLDNIPTDSLRCSHRRARSGERC